MMCGKVCNASLHIPTAKKHEGSITQRYLLPRAAAVGVRFASQPNTVRRGYDVSFELNVAIT